MSDEFAPLAPYYNNYLDERGEFPEIRNRIVKFDGATAWTQILDVAKAGTFETPDLGRFETVLGNLERLGIGYNHIATSGGIHKVVLRDNTQPKIYAK